MNIWTQMPGNQLLMSAVTGQVVAQFLKTLTDFTLNRNFGVGHLVGLGGMSDSHSATVRGLTAATPLKYGAGSFEFAVSFVFSIIVMYDATGVKRKTGKQTRLLSSILSENPLKLNAEVLQEKLKEYVGHAPLRVLTGTILGIGLALALNSYY